MGTYYNTQAKDHLKNGLRFDAVTPESFDTVASVAASTANTSVLSIIPLAQDVKCFRVAIACTAITGTATVEVVYGTGTPTESVGTPNVVPAANTNVILPQTISAANTVYLVNVPVPDVPYPKGGILTLRATTAASNTVTNLKAQVILKCVDPQIASAALPNTAGNYKQADPSNF